MRICIVGSWVIVVAGFSLKTQVFKVSFFTNMSFTVVHIYVVVSLSGTVARIAKTRRFITWVVDMLTSCLNI